MPAVFPAGSTTLAQLRSLAARGDIHAAGVMAITDNTYWPSMTAAAEAGDAIRISGQIKDQDGSSVTGIKHVMLTAFMASVPKTEVALATSAALPACTTGGSGVGKTLTASANAALSVDTIPVVAGDRILVKNQVAGADNGVYTVTATGSGAAAFVLTRATDFDQVGEMLYGQTYYVRDGHVNGGKTMMHTTTAAITVETTTLVFTDLDTVCSVGLGAAGATIKAKPYAREIWIQTTSTGAFSVDVTGASVTIGDVLIRAVTDNGETELVKITFA
jgi:hypothetical protein